MLLAGGATVVRKGNSVSVTAVDKLELDAIHIPGDLSSAAFFLSAGVLTPNSNLTIRDVGVNWTRAGFLQILKRMGANFSGDLEQPDAPLSTREPITDIQIESSELTGTVVEPNEVPLAIDELPLVALLGCFAQGETVVRGAQELRIKESDRIESVVEGLRGLGAAIDAREDGFVVSGEGKLRGGQLNAQGDHRLAMLGAIAGLVSEQGVEVVGMEAAAVSYPEFVRDLIMIS
jgi:3-phosphoshikimate 1-carboxyvinyltransferase